MRKRRKSETLISTRLRLWLRRGENPKQYRNLSDYSQDSNYQMFKIGHVFSYRHFMSQIPMAQVDTDY